MANVPKLGNVTFLPVREVWPNEATSFTPWLLENESVLGDVLGIEIELVKNEHQVGDFSLDLLGTNLTDDTPLIVENQLAKTDHSHLGQLLTYAGGLEPSTIIWIASEFRDEHRAALDWLNEITDERTHFFGVVVKAIRVDDSAPAPWLELVVQPNQWSELTKRATQSPESAEKKQRYIRFWDSLLANHRHQHAMFARKRAHGREWLTLSTGVGDITIGMNVQRQRIYVDLYFYAGAAGKNLARLEHLKAHQSLVEETFGDALSWEELDDRKACRVGYYGDGSILDEDSWPRFQEWLVTTALRFSRVTELDVFRELKNIGE
jgi:hypothetical protein